MPQRLVWNPFPTQWWSNWRVSPVKECQCWNAPWLKNNPLSSFPYQFNGSGPLLAYISARPTGGCARRAIHCISLVTSGFCGHASPSLLQLLTNRFICILVSKFCNQSKDFASIILLTRNNYGLNWLKYFLFLPFFHWKQIKLVHWKGYHGTDKNIWIQIFDWARLLTNYNAMLCDVFFAWNGFKEAKGLTSLFLLCLSVLCLWTYVCTYIALELDCTLINDFKPGIIAQCLKIILLRR